MAGGTRAEQYRLRIEAKFRPHAIAFAALVVACAAGHGDAAAQPAGASAVHGSAQVQQLGNSVLVTTTNGAGTRHSVIDWRSFSVPAGSTTRFEQPGVDSTSINRVLGNKPSDILGTLSSNGRLVLVNPAGIAVGKGAVVDTAGFTASTLGMSDADALAGRLRFAAGKGNGDLEVQGRVIARNGDVVLLGTDVKVGKDALVQAPGGSIVLAAGQKVELTGRGLEGIFLEVTAPGDRVVNLGRLEADAVGLFASQLRHSGVIEAATVVMVDDKVRLERGKAKDDKDPKDPKGKADKPDKPGKPAEGNSGTGESTDAGTDTGAQPSGGGGGTDAGAAAPAQAPADAPVQGGGTILITQPAPASGTTTTAPQQAPSPESVLASSNGSPSPIVAALRAPVVQTTQLSAIAVLTNYAAPAASIAQELTRGLRAGDDLVCPR
jgi:filamentous hemagglutinin family protein